MILYRLNWNCGSNHLKDLNQISHIFCRMPPRSARRSWGQPSENSTKTASAARVARPEAVSTSQDVYVDDAEEAFAKSISGKMKGLLASYVQT